MKKKYERCQCCGEMFTPDDRVVVRNNETGEVVDSCVLCREHFKAQDDIIFVSFRRDGIRHTMLVHSVCMQLAEKDPYRFNPV